MHTYCKPIREALTMHSSGEALAAWRQREGLTVRDLAYAAGVDASTVARMEAGDFAVAALPKTRAKVWRKAGLLVRAAATSNVQAPGWYDVRELDVVRGGELQVRPTSDGHEEYTEEEAAEVARRKAL